MSRAYLRGEMVAPRRASTLAEQQAGLGPCLDAAPLMVARVIPARVEVSGVDGTYCDPDALRRTATAPLRAADDFGQGVR